MRVALLAVDGMFDSGLSALLDVLAAANHLADPARPAPFEVTTAGVGTRIRTGHGHLVPTVPIRGPAADPPELLVLPALGLKEPDLLVRTVCSAANRPVLDLVRELRAAGSELAAACSGTFFLAESGVLDGLAATTSWWLGPVFRRRYPAVRLDGSRTLTRDRGVTTAGAAFAHIDLALSVVRRCSPALAESVARYLLIGDRPSQAAFAVPSLLAAWDPTIGAFERWIREHLADPPSITAAAAWLGVSERTLQRGTAAVVGMSPIDFVQEIRLDEATFLLRTTELTVAAVAARVGYRNAGTLRALIRRKRGTTTAGLRLARDGHPWAHPPDQA
jgi:transcriptional regulator GlxA family with amidase domain